MIASYILSWLQEAPLFLATFNETGAYAHIIIELFRGTQLGQTIFMSFYKKYHII